jgi:hypothetical protein
MQIRFLIRTEPASPPRAGPYARPPALPPGGRPRPFLLPVPAKDSVSPRPRPLTRINHLTHLSSKPLLFPSGQGRGATRESGLLIPHKRHVLQDYRGDLDRTPPVATLTYVLTR